MKKLFTILLLFSLVGFEVPHNATIPDNAVGVWECPSIGTATPLYWTEGTGQSIVDAEDSAAFRWYSKGRAILDHQSSEVGRGKWDVNCIDVGSSAFLILPDRTEQYKCVMVCLADVSGNVWLFNGQTVRLNDNQIVCACCADTEEKNYLAIFEFVGVMP